MTRSAKALVVPTGVVLVAALILLVLLARAQMYLAPGPVPHHLTVGAPAAAAPASQAAAGSASITIQPLHEIGPGAPLSAPRPATQQPAAEAPPAPGSAACPTDAGSGLPCRAP